MRRLLLATVIASFATFGLASAPRAQEPTIPIIVKDTTSFYWQIVLAGARKAGKDLRRQRARARRAVGIRHQRPDLDPRERGRRQAGRRS